MTLSKTSLIAAGTSLFLHKINSIAILSFPSGSDLPRLSQTALHAISEQIESLLEENSFHGVVLSANEKSFATGAEIEEVSHLDGSMGLQFALQGQALMKRIASFPYPVVAAIRGYCLGGGLDLALACHARVATFDSSFGHPGGTLGLITGWGGTQRLPRLIGKAQALQLLLTGERIPASQALTLGLVDDLVASQDLTAAAVRRCQALAETKADSPL